LKSYAPTVVCSEYNPHYEDYRTIAYNKDYEWDGTDHYGVSLPLLDRMMSSNGYTFVYSNNVNAFFIKDEFISNKKDFVYSDIANYANYHEHNHSGSWKIMSK